MAKRTAADRAYEHIRDKILTLELPQGSAIDETTLIEELQVSRAPIRDALRRLSQENLVVIRPRKGTFVSQITVADFYGLFELRIELEGYAAYLAAERAGDETLAQLAQLLEDAEQQSHEGSNGMDVEIDRRFHQIVYKASANKYLKQALDELLNHSMWLFNLSRTRSASVSEEIPDYRAIYESFQERNAARARRWMENHILESRERIRTSFAMQNVGQMTTG